MTGYSFTTLVWDGGAWVTPAVAEVRVTTTCPPGRPSSS